VTAVADTGPLNYLVLIDAVDALPELFSQIRIPVAVQTELGSQGAPGKVRSWIRTPPRWLEIVEAPVAPQGALHRLDPGEREVLTLASVTAPDVVILDERRGTKVAWELGLRTTGTLGVLMLASSKGLLDLREAVERLSRTNFRAPAWLLDAVLTGQIPG
jgi:predicted nucleic acid-binding protein